MKNSGPSPVLGFTEAELGIVLALLAAVVVALGVAPTPRDEPDRASITVDSLVTLEASLARVSVKNALLLDSLERQAVLIAAQTDSLEKLKSTIWPNCQPATPILILDVIGLDSYRIDGATVDITDVDVRTSEARAAATRAECRLIVGVRMINGLGALEYQRALDRLGALGLRTRALGETPL